jgi:hypothetical protein
MGDLLGSLIWGAKSGQYCVIGGESLHYIRTSMVEIIPAFHVVCFKILASAQIVCNIVCASARSNPQGIAL